MSPPAEPGVNLYELWLVVLLLVYVPIVAVDVIGRGFSAASGGAEGAERIFAFATNPVLVVILGTLATALAQSSSTVSSVIVGLVAGGLPVSIAIPMIMGANMGTTITNTIFSLGNLRDGPAFNRAFGAATVHDFFNLLYSYPHLSPDRGRLPPPRTDGRLLCRNDRRRRLRVDGGRERRAHDHAAYGQ